MLLVKNCFSGVPQGNILGPIFQYNYINDLPDCDQHYDIFLYAGDTKIFKRIACRIDCVLLKRGLNSIAN